MGWTGYHGNSRQIAQDRLAKARGGDQQALKDLYTAARPGGWRPDDRNSAIEAWNQLTPDTSDDLPLMKNPHGFMGDWDKAIGKGLKIAAPIAAMAIPGLGPIAGMAIGAGGSALGGQMAGDKFNLGKTALAGVAGYAGQKMDLGHKIFGGGMPNAPDTSGMGDSVFHPSGAGAAAAGASGSGILGGGGNGLFGSGISGGDLLKYGVPALGAYGAYQDSNKGNDLRDRGVRMAEQDYATRDPFRQRALSIGMQAQPQREDLSGIFSDPNNRWARPLQRAA